MFEVFGSDACEDGDAEEVEGGVRIKVRLTAHLAGSARLARFHLSGMV